MILDTIRDTESQFRITVRVNRSRSPQQAIEATGRELYTNQDVVNTMPIGDGDEVELVFFMPDFTKYDETISDEELVCEYSRRGLKPADPISVAAVNEADPTFANENPHCTHWKDADSYWCYASFYYLSDECWVRIDYHNYGWGNGWWFVGIRVTTQN